MERNASLKNERDFEENCLNVIFARNQANRMEKQRKEEI